MTNPNESMGTNAGYNGHTSPKAFNDILGALTQGVLSGWTCSPKSGMTVQLGGSGAARDIAIAEDNAGNRTTINNRNEAPVDVTISGAPSTGNRIDTIVGYVENPARSSASSEVDFADSAGIIAVKGTASGSPQPPTESDIRNAITADGADGTTAYYVELAQILVGTSVTTIGAGAITQGTPSYAATEIADGAITTRKIAASAITESKTDFLASSTNRLDIGSWHFYRTTFTNTTSGWTNVTLNVPNDFNGKIISVLTTATYGNSGNNYGSTWYEQTLGHVKVRINQATAGSNGWQALVVAVF